MDELDLEAVERFKIEQREGGKIPRDPRNCPRELLVAVVEVMLEKLAWIDENVRFREGDDREDEDDYSSN